MLNRTLKASIGVILLNGAVYANDETPKNWWQKGSYAYKETDKILTHIEGTISYRETRGNDEDKTLKTSILGKIRKGHLGASLSYSKIDEEKKQFNDKADKTPSETKKDYYKTTFIVGYDINKDFFVNAGYDNSRNTAFEIYNQTTQYIGVGYRILTLDAHRLNIFLAKGTDEISFGTYPQLPSGKTNGVYYQTDYSWIINPKVSLNLNYAYLKADMNNRDNSLLTAKVTASMFEHISLVIGYSDEYMKAQETVDRYTNDKTVFTAVKFEF